MTRLFDPGQLKSLRVAWRETLVTQRVAPIRIRRPSGSTRVRPVVGHLLLVPAICCGLLLAIHAGGFSIELKIGWVVMILLAILFSLAGKLRETLYASGDLAPLMLAPVADSDVFDWEWGKWLRGLWPNFVTTYALLTTLLLLQDRSSAAFWLAIPLTLATAGFALTAAPWLILFNKQSAGCLGLLTYGILFLVLIGGEHIESEILRRFVEETAFWLNRALPFGWTCLAGLELIRQPASWWWGIVLAVGSCFVWLPGLKQRLRESYSPSEEHLAGPGAHDDAEEPPDGHGRQADEAAIPVIERGLTERLDDVRAGGLRRLPDLPANGWCDSLLLSWLNDRETALCQLLFVGELPFSTIARSGMLLLGVAGMVAWGAASWPWKPLWFIAGFTAVFALFRLLPFNSWLRPLIIGARSGNAFISTLIMLPISFGEMVRLDLKLVLAQSLAALPVVMIGPYIVWLTGLGRWPLALGCGLVAWWALLASRPIASAWAVAAGTTRPTGRWARRFGLSFMKWSTVLLELLLVLASFITLPHSVAWTAGFCAAQLLVGTGYALWFGRAYNRGWLNAETDATQSSPVTLD